MNTLAALPAAGQECALYTFMNVREEAMELFGFCQKEERDMFKRLTSVSGIGPKSALGVLGSMPLADLRLAILTGDAAALSRAPGIGKKTAQRISLELKDKLAQDALSGAAGAGFGPVVPHRDHYRPPESVVEVLGRGLAQALVLVIFQQRFRGAQKILRRINHGSLSFR